MPLVARLLSAGTVCYDMYANPRAATTADRRTTASSPVPTCIRAADGHRPTHPPTRSCRVPVPRPPHRLLLRLRRRAPHQHPTVHHTRPPGAAARPRLVGSPLDAP